MRVVGVGRYVNRGLVMELIYIVLAAFGGAAKYIHGYLNGNRFEFWKLMASMFVSIFTGLTATHVAELIKPGWEKVACAVFAFFGGKGMDLLLTAGAKKLDVEIEKKRNSKDPVLEPEAKR